MELVWGCSGKAQPDYFRMSLTAEAMQNACRKVRIVQGMLFFEWLRWSVTVSAGEVAASDRGWALLLEGLYNWRKFQAGDTEGISCQTEGLALSFFFLKSLNIEALEREGFRLVAIPASQLACLLFWLTGTALQVAMTGA